MACDKPAWACSTDLCEARLAVGAAVAWVLMAPAPGRTEAEQDWEWRLERSQTFVDGWASDFYRLAGDPSFFTRRLWTGDRGRADVVEGLRFLAVLCRLPAEGPHDACAEFLCGAGRLAAVDESGVGERDGEHGRTTELDAASIGGTLVIVEALTERALPIALDLFRSTISDPSTAIPALDLLVAAVTCQRSGTDGSVRHLCVCRVGVPVCVCVCVCVCVPVCLCVLIVCDGVD